MSVPLNVSVAVPVYNEEDNVPELVRRIGAVLDALPAGVHQMLFVDDGSSDRTRALVEEAAHRDQRIVVVALSRNFGHQPALTAALDHVDGDVVILMDGDLQDRPEAIPEFLAAHARGYDVVYAQRVGRKEAWWLRLCYFLFYRLMGSMSRLRLPVDAGDFCLMSRRAVNELRKVSDVHRYLRGLRVWVGFRQLAVPVERSTRHGGRSKYGVIKLISLALDGIFSFSVLPLRIATAVGALAIALSGAFGLYAIYAALVLDRSPQGFTAQLVTIVFLSGVNVFFLGVIGEYVGRIYEQSKARPLYVVDTIVRGPENVSPGRPS